MPGDCGDRIPTIGEGIGEVPGDGIKCGKMPAAAAVSSAADIIVTGRAIPTLPELTRIQRNDRQTRFIANVLLRNSARTSSPAGE